MNTPLEDSPPLSRTLRALAQLLAYPDGALRARLPSLLDALRAEGALGTDRIGELATLVADLGATEALEAEASYVHLFDSGRSTSLNLFEHVHGDSRERGPAMIDLARTYEDAGLRLAAGELPDYLPVVLEYASTQPPAQARALLGEIAHVCNAIRQALARRQSLYAGVLAAVLDLAGAQALPVPIAADEPVDASWEEPAAFGGCSQAGARRHAHPARATGGVAP